MGTSWRTGLRISKILQSLLENWIPGVAHMQQNGWLLPQAPNSISSISESQVFENTSWDTAQNSTSGEFDFGIFEAPNTAQNVPPDPSSDRLLTYFNPAANLTNTASVSASHTSAAPQAPPSFYSQPYFLQHLRPYQGSQPQVLQGINYGYNFSDFGCAFLCRNIYEDS